MRARGKGSSPGRVEVSSRAMLATARPSCNFLLTHAAQEAQHDESDRTERQFCSEKGHD